MKTIVSKNTCEKNNEIKADKAKKEKSIKERTLITKLPIGNSLLNILDKIFIHYLFNKCKF